MPSLLHEGLIKLLRDQPQLTASLLDLLPVDVPALGEARFAEAALNELTPVEYHADAVVLFGSPRPVFGVIVEAQLHPDERKRFTWPVYVTTARSRHECPVVLIVVTMTGAMERWSAQPIPTLLACTVRSTASWNIIPMRARAPSTRLAATYIYSNCCIGSPATFGWPCRNMPSISVSRNVLAGWPSSLNTSRRITRTTSLSKKELRSRP